MDRRPAGSTRRLGAAVGVAAVVGVLLLGLVVSGGALAADQQAGDGSSDPPAFTLTASVHPGRPCAEPVETQGYKPGPGSLEPNHTGIDFVCLGDRTVMAILRGTVDTVVRGGCPVGDVAAGYGCCVVVRSDVSGHRLYVRYGHGQEGTQAVSVGETVTPGTPLEEEGSTGWSTGPHVHVEVDDGTPAPDASIDPAPFLDSAIVTR